MEKIIELLILGDGVISQNWNQIVSNDIQEINNNVLLTKNAYWQKMQNHK